LLRICLPPPSSILRGGQRLVEAGQAVSNRVPQDIEVDTVVSVTQSVTHTRISAQGWLDANSAAFSPKRKVASQMRSSVARLHLSKIVRSKRLPV
jgi:hypothetical protein